MAEVGAAAGPPPAARAGPALLGAGLLAAGAALIPLAALAPTAGAVLTVALLLVLLCALFPATAVAVYLALNPLVAGVDRGTVVPLLRLNEALLLPLAAGLLLAALVPRGRSGGRSPRAPALDVTVLALAVTGSVLPLLWMYARDRDVTVDDLLYAATLWKLAALYAAVRWAVRDERATRRLLWAVVGGALVVGVVGLLQTAGVGPVLEALGRLTPPEEDGYTVDGGRATSTLGNPIAYGDVMLYSALAAAALAVRDGRPRAPAAAAAGVLVLCALASGQVSVAVGLVVGALAFAAVARAVAHLILAGTALALVSLPVLWQVVSARLADTDPQTGLPTSWTGQHGRLENLRTYFWPEIGANWNWLLGVRPEARAPGAEPWREWVYIESGHTWLLWSGGIPLLVTFGLLLVAAVCAGRRLRDLQQRPLDAAVGVTAICVTAVLAVLMTFDPHLSMRGGAELFFAVLALTATADQRRLAAAGSAPAADARDLRPVTA